jgi:hypothetical protein
LGTILWWNCHLSVAYHSFCKWIISQSNHYEWEPKYIRFLGIQHLPMSPTSSQETAEQLHVDDWLSQTRCANDNNQLDCLYSLDADEIYDAVTDIWDAAWLFG